MVEIKDFNVLTELKLVKTILNYIKIHKNQKQEAFRTLRTSY